MISILITENIIMAAMKSGSQTVSNECFFRLCPEESAEGHQGQQKVRTAFFRIGV